MSSTNLFIKHLMSRRRLLAIFSLSLFIGLASVLYHHLTFYSFPTLTKTTMPTSTLSPGKAAIVVGSGLAGLSAASELIARGIPVHLLERSPKPGGNSIKASSGINGAPTKYQPGPPFSDSSFYGDTVVSAGAVLARASDGERKRREKLVARLTNESAGVIEWLNGKGVDLSVVVELGGHSFPRTHRGRKITPGWAIVSALLSELKSSPLFHLETSAVVTQMLTSGSRVEGVEYIVESSQVVEDAEYILKSGVVVQGVDYKYAGERIEKKVLKGPVIFASGGFAGDAHGMLAQYRPDLAGFPSTNEARPGSQPLLAEIGAQLVDMEQVQVHPTSFIDPKDPLNPVKFLAAELLRGEGGLLLHDGKRFVNEMENRKVVTDAIVGLSVAELAPMQWNVQLVLDEGVYANASSHVDFYIFKGLVKKTTLSELGSEAWKTIAEYSLVAAGEGSDVFGRKYFGHWELQPEVAAGESVVYVGTITPAVHFTMGGVLINEKSEVLRGNGVKIEAVWAAGEVAGGVHGGNRLGGSSLLECCVFGRTAGVEAAKFLQRDDEV